MRPDIALLEYRVGCVLQQGQNNKLHNLCDVALCCQTADNVYQWHPVIKYYATPNHDVWCRTVLSAGKMGLFATFSGSLLYP
ncbi:hypothetical protein TNCV_1610411 [Trichonephila clavipes]|nr:hypothetical protein TNCV_1610411 [Trichonephila clavipes]